MLLLSTPTSPHTRATCALLSAWLIIPLSGASNCPPTRHPPSLAPCGKALASTSMPSYQPAASQPLLPSRQRVPTAPYSGLVSDCAKSPPRWPRQWGMLGEGLWARRQFSLWGCWGLSWRLWEKGLHSLRENRRLSCYMNKGQGWGVSGSFPRFGFRSQFHIDSYSSLCKSFKLPGSWVLALKWVLIVLG